MAESAERLTRTDCLVVVLEDLHWSDVSTLDWLIYMARRREPARLLIIGTYRPTDALASGHPLSGAVQELQGKHQCEELRLIPLVPEGISAYLAERFAVDAGDRLPLNELADLLHHRTGGNPLFVVNTVDYLVQHGAVTEQDGQWTLHADKIVDVGNSIPDSVRQLIARQVERLPETEQGVLEAACVAGTEFAVAEVAAGLQAEVLSVESVCERLARTGLFIRPTGLAEWPDGTISGHYSFLHALYHEVLYSRLADLRRVQMHRRIAERKEHAYGERAGEVATELAVHYEKGRNLTRAVHYLGKAGENAAQRSAHREAIALLTQGVALLHSRPKIPEHLRQELQLQLALGVSFRNTKGPAATEVEHAYARACELSRQLDRKLDLFSSLFGLATSYFVRSTFARALALGEQMLAIAESLQDQELELEASLMAGMLHLYSHGDTLVALQHLDRIMKLYEPKRHRAQAFRDGQNPGILGHSVAAIALWCAGYPEQALRRCQEAHFLAQHDPRPYDQTIVLTYAALLYQHRRDGGMIREPAEAAVALATEYGFVFMLSIDRALQGWALINEGQMERGIEEIQRSIGMQQTVGIEILLVYFLALLAEAHFKAGHVEAGIRVLDEALGKVNTTGTRRYEAELYRLKGELTLARAGGWGLGTSSSPQAPSPQPLIPMEVVEEAEGYFYKAIDIAQRQHAKSWELRAAMSLARLWQQQDKGDQARELLEDIYTWFTEGFDTKDLRDAEALLHALGSTAERQQAKRDAHREHAERLEQHLDEEPDINESIGDEEAELEDTDELVSPSAQESSSPQAQSADHNVFRKEGDYWTIAYQGASFRLRHLRGLDYIAHLLRHPDVDFLALDVLTPSHELVTQSVTQHHPDFDEPSAPSSHLDGREELLDTQARDTYKRRLEELRDELEEAQTFNDLGRVEKLQEEMDFLSAELARALGLRGRPRTTSTAAERARVNVNKGIRIALAKIAEHCPPLEHHLNTCIKTGLFCSYTPPPFDSSPWEL
ncbi:MAG: hypothetical protein FJ147_05380 [Deltaproteobacteria bacterium]|nr:hypothetical protein [Deltaproteobacteria bacterium]